MPSLGGATDTIGVVTGDKITTKTTSITFLRMLKVDLNLVHELGYEGSPLE